MPIPPQFLSATINIIQGYGVGRFRIGQTVYTHPLLVSAEHVSEWALVKNVMTPKNLITFLEHHPPLEVVLFGTGNTIKPIPEDVRNAFRAKNIGVDVMDTGAACRTYHVLLAEKRRVGAALIPISSFD